MIFPRRARTLIIWALALFIFFLLLNIKLPTRQGVNFKVLVFRIPLYLKVLDFFDRHFNYGELAGRITFGKTTDSERIIKIFEWVKENIKKVPEGFPVVDDHIWHIIVRGYGTADQAADVFTVLCNYAGIDAFWTYNYSQQNDANLTVSYVKLEGKWLFFDPYNGIYFYNRNGGIASVDDIAGDRALLNLFPGKFEYGSKNYATYFENMPDPQTLKSMRSRKQMPVPRAIYEIKNAIAKLMSHGR